MNILCVIDCLGAGGAQRQIVELAIGFKNKGHNVSFLTYHLGSFYIQILDKNGIAINCIQESNYFKRIVKMRRFIRSGNYNAVLSFLEASNFICEISGVPYRRWKLVVGERSSNPNVYKSIKLLTYRFFHLLSDYVVSNSYSNMFMVQKINPFLNKRKCKVIYNAIDLKKWDMIPEYIPRKNGKLKIIVPASHQHIKNLRGLIEAVRRLSSNNKSKLTIEWYGEILDESYVDNKQRIINYGLDNIIHLLPVTHNIHRIIQNADVVGLFSFYEGMSNSICEGMACAKPIICSKVSDVPEYFDINSELLCNPEDVVTIKEAISNLVNKSNEELIQIGNKNRRFAECNFGKENIVDEYLKLLANEN